MSDLLFYVLVSLGIIISLVLVIKLTMNLLFKVEYYHDWKDRDENMEPKIKKRYVKR
jgi:hypothetical protein